MMKCVIALQKERLLHLYNRKVTTDGTTNDIEIICHRDIIDEGNGEITAAIEKVISEFEQEGRIFPYGQLRMSLKRKREMEANGEVLDKVEDDAEAKREALEDLRAGRPLSVASRILVMRISRSRAVLANSGGPPPEAMKPAFDPNITHGYQSRMMRLSILHEVLVRLAWSGPRTPTLYERFPPDVDSVNWPVLPYDELPVYVDDETPLRHLPSLPVFAEHGLGYVMLQDIIPCLPFSVVALMSPLSKFPDQERVAEFLTHPMKRHTLVGDLPADIRSFLMKDREMLRRLDHSMLTLSAMGLAALSAQADPRHSVLCAVYFISPVGMLRDTSTSDRGYASVSLPIDQYTEYRYNFGDPVEVLLYWHHLHAIVVSTPLSFRMDVVDERKGRDRDCRIYSAGSFDRSLVVRDPGPDLVQLRPLGPHDGVAGFDSALFVHLKRHWDMNPHPIEMAGWFVARWKRDGETMRVVIQARVRNLDRSWNSYVKALMPSSLDLTKIKKEQQDNFKENRLRLVTSDSKDHRTPKTDRKIKKRPLDNVDMLSQKNRLNLRARFSPKERDMLILIRAVGFFLNPVYRFWLDPTVLRDLMHEFVPEARTKTVQSLMAAGVRELTRPTRLKYLQRITRNLTSFPEMLALRSKLQTLSFTTEDAKSSFFKNAFRKANKLLFMEEQVIPPTNSTDETFEDFLREGKVSISTEQSVLPTRYRRSLRPKSLSDVSHCVAYNTVMSMLLSTDGSEALLDQLSPHDISSVLETMRCDGIVSNSRARTDQYASRLASISFLFRQAFAHRYHPEIVEQTAQAVIEMDEASGSVNADVAALLTLNAEDEAGSVVAASAAFYHNPDETEMDIDVSEDIMGVFDTTEENAKTKQIRYLESADLQLEKIYVKSVGEYNQCQTLSRAALLASVDYSIPVTSLPPKSQDDFLADMAKSRKSTRMARDILKCVQESDIFGASVADFMDLGYSLSDISTLIQELSTASLIVRVGVDCARWVLLENASAWIVRANEKVFFPRPWSTPDGNINEATIRWMAEAVFFAVVARPGILLDEIHRQFEWAIAPAAVDDLLELLQRAGCLIVHSEAFNTQRLSSPFQNETTSVSNVRYVQPTVDGIERFTSIFSDISLTKLHSGLASC